MNSKAIEPPQRTYQHAKSRDDNEAEDKSVEMPTICRMCGGTLKVICRELF